MTSADSTATQTTELLRLDTYPATVVFLHEAFAHRHDFIVDIKDVGIVVDWAAVAKMSSTEAAVLDAVRSLRSFETEGTGGPLVPEFRRYLAQLFDTP